MMVCQVCPSEKRHEIDAAIIAGESSRRIAKRYGPSDSAVLRHRECIRTALRAALEKRGSRLLQRVEKLCDQLESMADEAHTAKERGAFLMTARELRPTFLLAGQLSGEIASASVQAFLAALGVTGESDLRSALELRRSSSFASLDDFEAEVLAAVSFLRAERPGFSERVLGALGSVALGE